MAAILIMVAKYKTWSNKKNACASIATLVS